MKILLLIQILLLSMPTLACDLDDLKTIRDYEKCEEKLKKEIRIEAKSKQINEQKAKVYREKLIETKKEIDDLEKEYEKELDQYFEDHLDLNPKSEEFQNGVEEIRKKIIKKRDDLKQKYFADAFQGSR